MTLTLDPALKRILNALSLADAESDFNHFFFGDPPTYPRQKVCQELALATELSVEDTRFALDRLRAQIYC
jgi:hypothetical protein